MATLYELAHKARENDPEALCAILHLFEPKIKKSSRFIPFRDRDDVEQEVKTEIVRALRRFDISATPGFWEFIESLKPGECLSDTVDNDHVNKL
ncbi:MULTISPECIES: helix-turn-helix domain-containing protein [Aneurinibacillus]|uniref:Helix-turn-helix conjugative transposon-like domain-containing protein n=1 Tax=Aneurinibacillus thermoaerophilus TaxID=143495 RepID=A0A1G7ZG56_ANETH|nr:MULTISPECIES: helix-turn-helix domain-containing protein [Aneurinibacillus]MED0676542.1 helix-turn-helix domain-containing protein [Aneurinibacillus thermoaerophilus]MED0735959.1 helix-turn-helix domain-containing protein [Aneurinibacillus thermoaerophilus]MED0757085.1 helix-turn-helix domain-containing protein [Aneurinibacillus thermoaerophilus]MED0759394.1 helix-turn-helix domain-containing protein [Aneurinibacillus thermoaerophilus]SDH07664.1 hypothetical protein SAMN04489735_101083 [Ane